MLSKPNSYTLAFALMSVALVAAYTSGLAHQIVVGLPLLNDFPDYCVFVILLGLGIAAVLLGADEATVLIVGTVSSFLVLSLSQEPLVRYLILAGVLFSIGMYGMIISRNAVRVLMSIELMLNAVNINLVAFARYIDPVSVRGQLFAIFILTVAAAEAAVGLAIVLAIYRNMSTVDMEKFNLLKW